MNVKKGYLLLCPHVLVGVELTSLRTSLEEACKYIDSVKNGGQALSSLFSKGGISQFTYGHLNKEIADTLTELEGRKRVLIERMASRARELERQIESLETFLAGLEIRRASQGIGEEQYKHERDILALGLEAAKREIAYIKGDLLRAAPPPPPPTPLENPGENQTERPSKAQSMSEPVISERNGGLTATPLEEVVHEVVAAPEVAVEWASPKEVAVKAAAERRKQVHKVKRGPTGRVSKRKVKAAPARRSSASRGYSGGASEARCRNPWNGKCKNTDIQVTIWYRDEFVPICRECWSEIADKDLAW